MEMALVVVSHANGPHKPEFDTDGLRCVPGSPRTARLRMLSAEIPGDLTKELVWERKMNRIDVSKHLGK
jgi:hypothetical protein